MKLAIHFVVWLLLVGGAAIAHGHGSPIVVHVVDDKLDVTGGLTDTEGFVPMIFVESTSAGDPFGSFPLEPFGPITLWEVPGFELNGLQVSSGLYLEVLPRPVLGSDPITEQLLWYWDPLTEQVAEAPMETALYLLNSAGESLTLSPSDTATPPPFFVAAPLSDDLGEHRHLLGYALDNDPTAVAGAYGFFAELSSDLYETSDPFLVVLNNSVAYGDMVDAALAINAAAIDPNVGEELPGDYNGDDIVDAADYTVWRDAMNAGEMTLPGRNPANTGTVDDDDYAYWRANFGLRAEGAGSSAVPTSAPEPSSSMLFAIAWSVFLLLARKASFRSKPARGPTFSP